MPEVFKGDELPLFLAFFIPGFIIFQLYGLFVAVDDSDIAKQLPSIVGYSALHYAVTAWAILVSPEGPARTVVTYIVVFVLPLLWVPLLLMIRDPARWKPILFSTQIPSRMLKPENSPWDRVFVGHPWWVRIKLKDGVRVGGYLGEGSVTSTYPNPEQIFVSNAWGVDQVTGEFQQEFKGTGLLINGSEIAVIELIEVVE